MPEFQEIPEVRLLLRRFALHRDRRIELLCRHVGVSRTDYDALEALDEHGPLTPSELGRLLTLTSGSVTALIDRRLRGEEAARPTWVYARPFELHRGQRLSKDALVLLLNDLGYRQRPALGNEPGSFSRVGSELHLRRRGTFTAAIAVTFEAPWIS